MQLVESLGEEDAFFGYGWRKRRRSGEVSKARQCQGYECIGPGMVAHCSVQRKQWRNKDGHYRHQQQKRYKALAAY